MNTENTKPTRLPEEDEIDLIALAKTLWEGRKTILKTTIIFMAIGLFVAIFSEKEYTASTTFVPQSSDGKSIGGNLGGLAAMAGINLGSLGSDSGISPALYPQIVNSIPFQKELLQTPLNFEGQKEPISYAHYYTEVYTPSVLGYLKKFTIGLPGLIIKALKPKPTNVISSAVERDAKGNVIARRHPELVEGELKQSVKIEQPLTITEDEKELIERLEEQLTLDVNDKDGYVTLSVNLAEALPAAQLAKKAQALLQQYIIAFKVQKSTAQLQFIQERYTEKEQEFKTAQQQLARFRDRNQHVTTALAQTTLERLQAEYDLVYGVFSELAKQLETQQLQVKEDTPVFTVLKPVNVPVEKSAPKRGMILVIWVFLGGIAGVIYYTLRIYFKTIL